MTIRLALDWTPNTNHTGFYVALANGYYQQAGLDVQILSPDQDNYQTTPAKKVHQGQADLAIAPSESVISFHLNGTPMVAVAAVLARDASAIVTLQQSGIDRPKELDGKVYASYGARFEDEIISQMIINDGGRGHFVSHKPAKLDIWHALLTNEVDATWIFLPWEGVEADLNDISLNRFQLSDYDISYGYSPVLAANRNWASENADALRSFLAATAQGFHLAVDNPEEAAELLVKTASHPTLANRDFVEQSQQVAANYYLNSNGQWGVMSPGVWRSFINWLVRNRLLTTQDGELVQELDINLLFTNEFLSPGH